MFHFCVVFLTLFSEAKCLEDIRELLCLRSSIYDVYIYTKEIDSHIQELVKKILSRYSVISDSYLKINAKEFIVKLHWFGKQISSILTYENISKYGSVVSGSFALATYMHLNMMDSFQPSDIDVYQCLQQPISMSMHRIDMMKLLRNGKTKVITSDEDEHYIGTRRKTVLKSKLIEHLNNHKKWSKYDWDELLKHHSESWKVVSKHILQVYWLVNTKIESDINVIVCEYNTSSGLSSFADYIISRFDMIQCQVAISDITGTFYPTFHTGEETSECVKNKKIKFNPDYSFGNRSTQYSRIRKYMKRGFGLVTNPEKIHRLPM